MELVPHLQHVVATYGYLAVFLIVAMESAGIPMPGETVLVTAAIFAATGTLKIYWVIGAAAAGAILGDNCGYWVGREFGLTATIAVPEHAPEAKLSAIERLGGKVVKLPYDDWWRAMVSAASAPARALALAMARDRLVRRRETIRTPLCVYAPGPLGLPGTAQDGGTLPLRQVQDGSNLWTTNAISAKARCGTE